MIKHIVFWKVKPAGDRQAHLAAVEELRKRFEYLKTVIPEILEAQVGYNFNDGDVFNMCIDSLFRDEEGLNAYIVHPEHLKLREWLNSVTYDKAIFDFVC